MRNILPTDMPEPNMDKLSNEEMKEFEKLFPSNPKSRFRAIMAKWKTIEDTRENAVQAAANSIREISKTENISNADAKNSLQGIFKKFLPGHITNEILHDGLNRAKLDNFLEQL